VSIHVGLTHRTVYRYDRPVTLSPQLIRLRPAPHTRTKVLSYSLKVEPKAHFLNWQQDPHGNWLARVVFQDKVTEFSVTVDLIADFAAFNAFDFFVAPEAENWPFEYEPALAEDLKPFRHAAKLTPRFSAYLDSIPRDRTNTVNFLVKLNQELQQKVKYLIRMEPGVQTPEKTLENASGSCRDTSWLLVQTLRHLGFAARFVSGYLLQLRPDMKALEGPSGPEADFTDLHAWAEVYLPGAGWVGLDPTSGLLVSEGHIPLCASPEPQSAAPISGNVDPSGVEFSHEMRVARLIEAPRVTRPYTDAQWQQIDALGRAVEERLTRGDVRLTMGGEPTFVSLDDMQGAEWNTAALGERKQVLALALIERLRARFAPQGLLTWGQGKWYPGESLPRWVYTLYWRGDGKPLWQTVAPKSPEIPSVELAQRFIARLAQRLALNPENAVPAYEDVLHYLMKERRLPVNVDPADNRLANPEERARLLEVFERGVGAPRGFVLPLQRAPSAWVSERWQLRGGRMFLLPGDSPIGLRLPLESLPWIPAKDVPQVIPADPTVKRGALADGPQRAEKRGQSPFSLREKGDSPPAGVQQAARDPVAPRGATPAVNVRTALAVEPRDGFINVFMPPVTSADDFVELIAAIEETAAALKAPVRIEGYAPPADARLNYIKITPDPGVIEVNVHPARSWDELRDNTLGLYEDARQARLTTEKFLIDGRAVGTGGGNHIVLGAATPLDSPFLRRPDVLASLLRYWQNHPSLSFLFSGLFIGPTSQHPRVDEGRDAQLHELELALTQLPGAAPGTKEVEPWLVDRVLRHLLIDLSGNTHRTEFCIDKLYAPESATGRLGLLELRAFEMPPHARMSLAQQLLVRALVCRFWEKPYTRPLIRFGTQLHDRFMLPHYLWQDFTEVLDDLRADGFAFHDEWFLPHLEFRFPRHGAIRHKGVEIELRQALEPWLVLGEEPAGGGTARYVDSSLERLQVRATGLYGDRWWVTCNGRAVPLAGTDNRGERIAGVRYRAWQPWSCLHPTIGAHTPLVFDLYDRWNGRAVAGCTYHVADPASRHYGTFPVNALEAESRRLARFQPMGHTPGVHAAAPPRVDPEYPCTLDLRQPG
jgi:uncharacterized protein (DUF2126 family)